MSYLEILFDSVMEIIEHEGINPISRIEVNEEIFEEFVKFQSIDYVNQKVKEC